MQTYLFKITSHSDDEFIREIEIKSDNSFLNLYNFLVKILDLNDMELASFFVCDNKWQKFEEITLIDMGLNDDDKKFYEEEYENQKEDENRVNKKLPVSSMETAMLSDKVADDKLNIILEYNFLNPINLYIQLTKINKAVSTKKYPILHKYIGELEFDQFGSMFSDLEIDDFSDFDTGFDEESNDMFDSEGSFDDYDNNDEW